MKTTCIRSLFITLVAGFACATAFGADSAVSGTITLSGDFVTSLSSLTLKASDCGTNYSTCLAGLNATDFTAATNSVNLGNTTASRYVAFQAIVLGRLFRLDHLTIAASLTQNTNSVSVKVKNIRYIHAGGGGQNLEGFSGATDLPEAADVTLATSSQVLWDQASSAAGASQTTPINFLTNPTALEMRGIIELEPGSTATSANYQGTVNLTWTAVDGSP